MSMASFTFLPSFTSIYQVAVVCYFVSSLNFTCFHVSISVDHELPALDDN